MTDSYFGYRILLLLAITAINGFFAAAEVALLSVRRSRLEALAQEGHLGAQAALSLLANPEKLLSVVQVGISITSMGLGWAGEDTIYSAIVGLFGTADSPFWKIVTHAISIVLSFLILTVVLVVLGEVVPKNIAIEKAEQMSVLAAPALLVFYKTVEPFVYMVEKLATVMSRALGARGHSRGGHSGEELKFIVASSRAEGHLAPFEEDAIAKLIDLNQYVAREIMTPRNQIVSLPIHADLDQVLRVMGEHLFSRLPVYEGSPEHIVGVVHYRDLLAVWQQRRRSTERRRSVPPFQLRDWIRKPLVIPETKPLNQLIDEFRTSHQHLAIVVDEFGTIAGIVTMEDVLEQVFGEIEDEHDLRRLQPQPEAAEVEIEGTIPLRDLETQYGLVLPTEDEYETLAGFLLFKLGHIPQSGETVEAEGRRFTITGMDRNRIAHVRMEKLP